MKKTLAILAFCLLVSLSNIAVAQQGKNRPPGLEPYTPTKIEWLTLTLQASLRTRGENGFTLDIVCPDYQTILIYVRYLPNVNREAMNLGIDTARQVISIKAKQYGWSSWVKIKEDIKLYAE